MIVENLSNEELKRILTMYLDEKSKTVIERIRERIIVLQQEEPDYYDLLEIFDLSAEEAALVDRYHNIGRLVFRNLGTIVEELTLLCLQSRVGGLRNATLKNTVSSSPSAFGIDWLYEERKIGYEIKWRYATTDG
ncbi:MAG: ApaLI family restriction endonuclease, partial [Bradymonadaceae bacterium]